MNTNNIKKYAPQARREFIEAVGKRLNQFGVYSKGNTLTITEPAFSGSVMQINGNSFDAGLAQARKRLTMRAEQLGFDPLVEKVAYTWFNRLCAIRFMELQSGYLEDNLRVLSHPEKAKGFELLDHAQDVAEDLGLDRSYIVELKLAGNKDEELYRHLLLGQCHKLHEAMPFLFEALDDETELLLPDNLTRTDSILRGLVDSIPEEDWQQVEIIGWLYQFYISEKKDQVIGSVVKSEDIPAATQLFTPNWIVKYLVQNSVGRQWLMTYPDSGLKALMEYYIEPAEQDSSVTAALAAITPASIEPESIKVIDPACGSGHILVEAYDLLKAIYEERGYRSRDIPKLILENNLVGLDIDDRAAQLAGFALMMKAREDDRRIFTRDIKLNVLALQSTQDLNLPELWRKLALNKDAQRGMTESLFDDAQTNLIDAIDDSDFTALQSVLVLFEQAKTFGSLIQVPADKAEFLDDLKNQLEPLIEQGDNYQKPAAAALLPFVQQAWLLAQRYDAIIANPPYMGGKGMNPELKAYSQKHFPDSKSDLFAMFMERAFDLLKNNGYNAQVNMQSWMFLSSYQAMREKLLDTHTFITMAHLGARAFGQISGEVVQTTAFVLAKNHISYYRPTFFRLIEGNEEVKRLALLNKENVYNQTEQDDFKKIPGSPVAYWASERIWAIFGELRKLGEIASPKIGMRTGDNERFMRLWYEVDILKTSLPSNQDDDGSKKWFPYNKGGTFRKWYGNFEYIVNWENDGLEIKENTLLNYPQLSWDNLGWKISNEHYYFNEGVTWTDLSSSSFGVRYLPKGFIFDASGPCLFGESPLFYLAFLVTKQCFEFLKMLNPTLHFKNYNISALPIVENGIEITHIESSASKAIEITRNDWDFYETSWDFTENPLIRQKQNTPSSATQDTQEGLTVRPEPVEGWTVKPLMVRQAHHERLNLLGDHEQSKLLTTSNGLVGYASRTFTNDPCHPEKVRNAYPTLEAAYQQWQAKNRQTISEMQRIEQENNRLFIDAYGLQDELEPDVPLEQITLTINPKYRYGGNLSDAELAQRFQSDTLVELISYAIGCMMGRYRIDKPGLIYAHSGNVDFDKIYNSDTTPPFEKGGPGGIYLIEKIPPNPPFSKGGTYALECANPFQADDDGIIPLTDQEWFKDDATNRFRDFVRTVWGEEHLQFNLDFVAESLCLNALKSKKSESSVETIRRYLSTQFYKDHLKTYKKRPIYWLFSSGKQKAFECLVYLHRYNESTLSRMRTGYVTPLLGKYDSFADQLNKQIEDATTSEGTQLKKELVALEKKQTELRAFDDHLKHYADMRIKLDLDEGVKVNYGKFGDLLAEVKAITGGKE